MKKNSCSHKLRCEGYLKLIYRCLSYDMYTKLTSMRVPYEKITCIYGKTHVIVL